MSDAVRPHMCDFEMLIVTPLSTSSFNSTVLKQPMPFLRPVSMNSTVLSLLVLASRTVAAAVADSEGGMMMDSPADYADAQLLALHEHWRSRTAHWLFSLFMLIIIPSVSAAYAVANRPSVALVSQIISGIYALLEAIILRFEDPDGHENRTSRGTAWFMIAYYGVMIFNGSVSFGLSMFGKRLTESKWKFVTYPFSGLSYKLLSCASVLLGLIKLSMSVVALLGFCYDAHTGQCNAHGIMGMSFIFYGFILAMVLVIPWLRVNTGKFSQEFYDSAVIMAWGIVNTFTEHRPWEPWSHGDYQHTSMGIIFWAAGMLGVFLSLGRKRSFIPALTLIFTGYAMSEHVQKLVISTKVHGFFGYVLMFGGLARILEISFLLDDQDAAIDSQIRSFQYLSPFALVLSGILFMGATEEQLQLVVNMGADHSSYILVLTSAACLLQLWLLAILKLYLVLVNAPAGKGYESLGREGASMGEEGGEFHMDDLSEFDVGDAHSLIV